MQKREPIGLKYGFLQKCSHTLKLWRTAWFVLGPTDLRYYKRGIDVPTVIDLQQAVSIVTADVEDSKRPHSFKLTSPSIRYTLILAGETSEVVEEWIAAIRTVASLYGPPPETAKGPVKLTLDQKDMLQSTSDICLYAGKLIPEAAQSDIPGVYVKGILDNLGNSALQAANTGRVVVYKPKLQTGFQRFSASMIDVQSQVIGYARALRTIQKRKTKKGKRPVEDPFQEVINALDSLVNIVSKIITKWMPDLLDQDLSKKELEDEVKEEEIEEEVEEEKQTNPYVSPFFVALSSNPAPCEKPWDVVAEECASLVNNMATPADPKATTHLKLPPASTIDQAKQFLELSRKMHETASIPNPPDEAIHSVLSDDQFSLMKQQLLGSSSAIEYHTSNIPISFGLCGEHSLPPPMIEIISHAYGISSAIARLPRAIKKHRGKTLVSVVEQLGSFAFSIFKLITQVDQEKHLRDQQRGKQALLDEAHAVQYIALHMLSLCPAIITTEFQNKNDILHFTDTAKLLALGVSNFLESMRLQSFVPKPRSDTPPRKLASELTDATTGSMVFWFGMVGQSTTLTLDK